MTDAEEIAAQIRAVYGGFTGGDAGGMAAGEHPEFTIWDVFEPDLIVGQAARDRFRADDLAQARRRGPLFLSVDDPIVTVWGDAAIARYHVTFRYDPPGAASGRVRATTVYKREGGRWLRIHHHEGIEPPGRPPFD